VFESPLVFLFKDIGKELDIEKSKAYFTFDGHLTYTDGTKSEIYSYMGDDLTGINTFKDVPNGNYIIWVNYRFGTYIQYFSSKKITVNYDYRVTMEKKVFDFEIDGYKVFINGKLFYHQGVSEWHSHFEKLAQNDGLTTGELKDWFKMPCKFEGQIICWDDSIKY